MAKFTERSIKKLPRPATGALEVSDELLPNLVLRIHSTGGYSWCVRYRAKDSQQQRRLTLGKWPALNVDAARDAAAAVLRRVAKGEDPQGERAMLRSGEVPDAFVELAERFVVEHCKERNRTWIDQARVLGLRLNKFDRKSAAAKPRWHIIENSPAERWQKRGVATIERHDVGDMLRATASSRGRIAANKLRMVLSRFFGWLVENGIIQQNQNPVTGTKPPSPTRSRDRTLSEGEITLLWRATAANQYPFDPFTRLLLLTGQRRDELAGMRVTEIMGDVWKVPIERRGKSANPVHEVPLSKLAMKIIRSLPRSGDLLFSTNGRTPISGYSKAKHRLDEAIEDVIGVDIAPWRLHDLRRTADTHMHALGIDHIVVEKILDHKLPGVAAVYNRHDYLDEKRAALEKWAQQILALDTELEL